MLHVDEACCLTIDIIKIPRMTEIELSGSLCGLRLTNNKMRNSINMLV